MLSLSSTPAVKPQPPPPSKPPLSTTARLSSLTHISDTVPSLTAAPRRTHRHLRLQIRAIDAAQPYDYESKVAKFNNNVKPYKKLKIAIVGFGNYGQFLAKALVKQGHTVLAHSRTNYAQIATKLGVSFFTDPHDLCEEHPEVILLCTSILSTEAVLKSLPLQRLKRSTLFVDVLSVKEFPRSLFLQNLPNYFDILCTHPMFGPESGRLSWEGLPFVYDKVRIGSDERREKRCENFLDCFRREGCRVEEMSCAEHDRYAAGSQFITHFVGRVLEKLELEDTPINTKGYESLLNLVDNTSKDSFELFYGLFLYNKNAIEQLERLDTAFEKVKRQLFGNLHSLCRSQLFVNVHDMEMDERAARRDSEMKFLSDVSEKGNGNGNGRVSTVAATLSNAGSFGDSPQSDGHSSSCTDSDKDRYGSPDSTVN